MQGSVCVNVGGGGGRHVTVGKAGGEQSGEELNLSGELFGGQLICSGKPLTFLGRGGADKICVGKWGPVWRRKGCVCARRELDARG